MPNRDALIVQLLRVARGLEATGEYNVAKLYRAAAAGEGYRASRAGHPPGPELDRAMADAIDALRAAGWQEPLLGVLEASRQRVQAGDFSPLTLNPRVFVCRECGDVLLSAEPPAEPCPACRARPLLFEEILWIHYFEPLSLEETIATLEAGMAEVERLTSGVSEEQAERGTWPMRAIIEHLWFSEDLLSGRARRMLDEDEPELVSVQPDAVTLDTGVPFTQMVAQYVAARRATLALARSLNADQLQRTGFHPEWGRITVHQQLTWMARHEQSHLAELEARRMEQG